MDTTKLGMLLLLGAVVYIMLQKKSATAQTSPAIIVTDAQLTAHNVSPTRNRFIPGDDFFGSGGGVPVPGAVTSL